MIILDATTKTLEIDLAGAVTTNQLPVVASYVDVTTTAYTPISSDTATNSTTAVTIVSAPAASTQRQVKLLTVYNADTVSVTVTIQLNNNSTLRSLVVVTLAVGSTLVYTDGEGWRVLTSAGAVVTSTLSPMTSAQLAAIISDETGSGSAVFATSPILVTPALGTPSALVLTNATGLPTAGLVNGAVTLAKMADLAQDQFIGRTTASTGVPQTATITAAARTVLDDPTVASMVDTLGGASSVGTGGLARATSPVFGTNISTPAIVSPGALTVTPAAGSGVAIVLSGAGDFVVNTNQFVVDTSAGNVGIGTTAPTRALDVVGDINETGWYRVGGSAVLTSGAGYTQLYAGGGSGITLSTNATEVVRVTSTGNVGIGTTSPAGKLHSKQASTTAAIPVLELEQLDVSEEFINFVAASAASVANPITTWTTGGTIAGHVRIGINGTFYWFPFFTAPTA